MQRSALARIFLLAGLIVVFGFFGIDKFWHPLLWIGWIPAWMDGLFGIGKDLWLKLIGSFEILCALLLLVPLRRTRQTGALLIALQLLSIIPIAGFNDIGLRDFGLLTGAAALFLLL